MTVLALLATALLTLQTNLIKGFSPLNVKAHVSLVPSDDNRNICVWLANVDMGDEQISCRSLNGEKEPKSIWYEWKKLSAGRWRITIQVERAYPLKALEAYKVVEVISSDPQ